MAHMPHVIKSEPKLRETSYHGESLLYGSFLPGGKDFYISGFRGGGGLLYTCSISEYLEPISVRKTLKRPLKIQTNTLQISEWFAHIISSIFILKYSPFQKYTKIRFYKIMYIYMHYAYIVIRNNGFKSFKCMLYER